MAHKEQQNLIQQDKKKLTEQAENLVKQASVLQEKDRETFIRECTNTLSQLQLLQKSIQKLSQVKKMGKKYSDTGRLATSVQKTIGELTGAQLLGQEVLNNAEKAKKTQKVQATPDDNVYAVPVSMQKQLEDLTEQTKRGMNSGAEMTPLRQAVLAAKENSNKGNRGGEVPLQPQKPWRNR